MNKEKFDPSNILKLAKEQYPLDVEFHKALDECSEYYNEGSSMFFLEYDIPYNEMHSRVLSDDSQFLYLIFLHDTGKVFSITKLFCCNENKEDTIKILKEAVIKNV